MRKQLNKEKGFTIIEVVLVLAIAGLIFLIVFLALPQLQRSRRDTQRRGDAGKVLSALEAYASNSNGQYPTDVDAFAEEYVTGKIASPGGEDYTVVDEALEADSDTDSLAVLVGSVCDGSGVTAGGARDAAVQVKLEEGIYCQDNK